MTFVEMNPAHLPLALLLEADPAASRIAAYLPGAWGFAALADNEVVGACVLVVMGAGLSGSSYLRASAARANTSDSPSSKVMPRMASRDSFTRSKPLKTS